MKHTLSLLIFHLFFPSHYEHPAGTNIRTGFVLLFNTALRVHSSEIKLFKERTTQYRWLEATRQDATLKWLFKIKALINSEISQFFV